VVTGPSAKDRMIAGVLLAILGAWAVCAVLVAIAVAAIGRSGLREDQALGHLPPAGFPDRCDGTVDALEDACLLIDHDVADEPQGTDTRRS
jgi:hypothetical protein